MNGITILHARKFYKGYQNIARSRSFRIARRSVTAKKLDVKARTDFVIH